MSAALKVCIDLEYLVSAVNYLRPSRLYLTVRVLDRPVATCELLNAQFGWYQVRHCLLYTSPSPRD